MEMVVAMVAVIVALVGCSNDDHRAAQVATPTTAQGRAFTAGEEYAACIATARAIEAAAAANFAKTGSFGTVADLVAAGYLKTAPKESWGLAVGADGSVDVSTCQP